MKRWPWPALTVPVLTAVAGLSLAPAGALAGNSALNLNPGHGGAGATFTAVWQFTGGGACPFQGGTVVFAWLDLISLAGSALVDSSTCSARATLKPPDGAEPGDHTLVARATAGSSQSDLATAPYTIDAPPPPPPASPQPGAVTQPSATPRPTPTPTASATPSPSPTPVAPAASHENRLANMPRTSRLPGGPEAGSSSPLWAAAADAAATLGLLLLVLSAVTLWMSRHHRVRTSSGYERR